MYRVGWMTVGALAALAGCWALVAWGQAEAEAHLAHEWDGAAVAEGHGPALAALWRSIR